MSQPPRLGLMPLSSSLLPNVGAALQRRARRDREPAHETRQEPGTRGGQLHELFDGQVDEDGPLSLGGMPQARAPAPTVRDTLRLPTDGSARTYTLGQLVEAVKARRAGHRRIVESGDPDGPEEAVSPHTIVGRALKAMQGG